LGRRVGERCNVDCVLLTLAQIIITFNTNGTRRQIGLKLAVLCGCIVCKSKVVFYNILCEVISHGYDKRPVLQLILIECAWSKLRDENLSCLGAVASILVPARTAREQKSSSFRPILISTCSKVKFSCLFPSKL